MHRLDSVQRDTELTGILDVQHQPIRIDVANRTELLAPVGYEGLIPRLDRRSHDQPCQAHSIPPSTSAAPGRNYRAGPQTSSDEASESLRADASALVPIAR